MKHVAALITLALLAAGCSDDNSGPDPAATPSAAHRASPADTETAVKRAAQINFDAFATGEYGDSYDTWTKRAKKVISRADYVKICALCPAPGQGVPFTITSVQLAADGKTAKVRTTRTVFGITAAASYAYRYEAGEWRWEPTAQILADFRQGLTPRQVAARRRQAGQCGPG